MKAITNLMLLNNESTFPEAKPPTTEDITPTAFTTNVFKRTRCGTFIPFK